MVQDSKVMNTEDFVFSVYLLRGHDTDYALKSVSVELFPSACLRLMIASCPVLSIIVSEYGIFV